MQDALQPRPTTLPRYLGIFKTIQYLQLDRWHVFGLWKLVGNIYMKKENMDSSTWGSNPRPLCHMSPTYF